VRRSHPEHGRVLQTYLTEEGVGLVVRAHWVVEAIEERMLSNLGKEERR
jgi:DNA-binding MarR family transcriptional regulator